MRPPNLNNFGKKLKFNKRSGKKEKIITEKELFIETVNLFQEAWTRSNSAYEVFQINLIEYEEKFYQIIENLFLMKYGLWKTEIILWYIFARLDDEGNVRTMIDPFAGSGGFTLGYANYLQDKYSEDINWKSNVDNIYHFDMEESVVNMTGLEMFAITGYFPYRNNCNYIRQNSFNSEILGHNNLTKYDYVFSNPPYGGDKNTKTAQTIKRDKIIEYIKGLKDDATNEMKKQLEKLLKNKKQEKSSCIIKMKFFLFYHKKKYIFLNSLLLTTIYIVVISLINIIN